MVDDSREKTQAIQALREIDSICQEFESSWKAGQRPNIKDFVANLDNSSGRTLLLELLLLELEYRRQMGEEPSFAEYETRFPNERTVVLEAFDGQRTTDAGETTARAQRPPHPPTLPGYEVVRALGEGGMGVVYLARQLSPERMVAVKIIRPDRLEMVSAEGRQQLLQRFQAEAQAAAKLEHKNIVPVYEVGQTGEHTFFSMRYIEGKNLHDHLKDGPFEGKAAARLLTPVIQAVHFAHVQGVLHRDLKPHNLLISDEGHAYVTDFGLARSIELESDLTQTGAVLGTPSYMSPEQAQGQQQLNAAADIYSLGATLYEMCAGRPPFRASSVAETLRQVIHDEPVSPRRLNPAVDRDMETICLKCLEKDPAKRYATAEELALELERYETGKPIHARPLSRFARACRWGERNPGVTILASSLVLLLLTLSIGGPVAAIYARGLQTDAENKTNEAQIERNKAQIERNKALVAEKAARKAAAAERRKTYIADMKRVEYFWGINDIATARGILDKHVPNKGQADLRGFEWRFWRRETSREVSVFEFSRNVQEVAVSPDGEFFAAAEQGGTITLQRLTADEPQRRFALKNEDCVALDFSQDGSLLAAAGGQGLVRIWDVISGDMVDEDGFPTQSLSRGYSAFDAGCDRYAWSFGGTVGIRDRHAVFGEKGSSVVIPDAISGLKLTGGEKTSIRAMPSDIASIGKIKMASWSPTSETKPGSRMLGGPIYCLDFCSTQELLAAAGYGGVTKILSLNDGRSKQVISGHDGLVFAAKFSPDGRQIATGGSDGVIRIWDVETGAKRADLVGHTSAIYDLAFVAKGRLLASGSSDRTVRLWDTTSGKSHAVLKGHEGSVESLCVFDDGKMIASAGDDQTVRVWAIPSLKQNVLFRRDAATTLGAAFAPDSKHLGWVVRSEWRAPPLPAGMVADVSYTDQLCVWNWQDEREVISKALKLRQNYEPDSVAFAGDASRVAVSSVEYHLKWEGDRPNRFPSLQGSFGYRHRTRATETAGSLGPAMYLPDLVFPGVSVGKFPGTDWKAFVTDLDFCLFTALSPDGKTLAVASDDFVQLWDLAARKQRLRLDGHTNFVRCVAFSIDGKTLASASSDGSVKLWDVRAGKLKSTLRGHDGGVSWVAISPDSRTIASAGRDGTIRLWDSQSGEETTVLSGHAAWVTSVAFSPDGQALASTSSDGTVRVWRAESIAP